MTYHLHVDERGEGDAPVVLLHGLGGSSRYWTTLLARPLPRWRCYAPDLLGFGRSPWPRVEYTVDAHLAALDASLPAGAAFVVGHSLGAVLALERAARSPTTTRGVVAFALPYFDDEGQARDAVGRGSFWGRLLTEAPLAARVLCACVCRQRWLWSGLLPVLLPHVPKDVVADALKHSFRSVRSTLLRCVLQHRVDAAAEALARAGVPMRLVVGEDDPVATPERAAVFARRFGAAVDVVPRGTHLFSLTDVDATWRLLRAALDARAA